MGRDGGGNEARGGRLEASTADAVPASTGVIAGTPLAVTIAGGLTANIGVTCVGDADPFGGVGAMAERTVVAVASDVGFL